MEIRSERQDRLVNSRDVGYRLLKEAWGRGIATEALRLLTEELLTNRGIEIITASTMIENKASAHVLQKNGYLLVSHAVYEDWGYQEPRWQTNGSGKKAVW